MIPYIIELEFLSFVQNVCPFIWIFFFQLIIIIFCSRMMVDQFFERAFSISIQEHEFLFHDSCDVSLLFTRYTIIEDSEFYRVIDEFLDKDVFVNAFQIGFELSGIMDFLYISSCSS